MVKKQCMSLAYVLLVLVSAQAQPASIPKPKLKPNNLRASETIAPAPSTLKFPPAGLALGWPNDVLKDARAECQRRLQGLDVQFAPLPPMGKNNSCGAPAPLSVEKIAGVAIVPPGIFTCDMVEALHGWVGSSVLPAARQFLKREVVTINNASAYVCRRRNGLASGKLSEHAKANALDIATLGFDDGSSINIKGDWSGIRQLIGASAKGNFLRIIRRDSCIRFTTVLGPGSDKYHGDHFHIDVARRKNGYRICN